MMNANTARTLTNKAIDKRKACQDLALETAIAESMPEWENKITFCASWCTSYAELDTLKAYNKVFAMLAPEHAMSREMVNEVIADYMRSYGYRAELMRNSTVRIYW